jgi:AcrR family transcriptional regulator
MVGPVADRTKAERPTRGTKARRTAESGPRPRTPKGEATRARFIELAAAAFAEEGYAAVSIRGIAARSGLSSGAIYGTFRGKAELLAEAVDATIASDVETLPESVMAATLPEIEAYQYEHGEVRTRIRTLLLEAAVAARTDVSIRDRVAEALQPHLDMATAAQEEWGHNAAVNPDVDMRALVTLLWSADLGLAVLDALGIDTPSPVQWSNLLLHPLRGLEAAGAEPGAPSPLDLPRRS